jgi:hypothetical protein
MFYLIRKKFIDIYTDINLKCLVNRYLGRMGRHDRTWYSFGQLSHRAQIRQDDYLQRSDEMSRADSNNCMHSFKRPGSL